MRLVLFAAAAFIMFILVVFLAFWLIDVIESYRDRDEIVEISKKELDAICEELRISRNQQKLSKYEFRSNPV